MTRHSKNCTASAVYSYHERSRDSRTAGYGTQKARLGRDSVREFDCCSLTLQPCRNPVVTPDGHLFDKEAVLEYIIGRKREISRQLKEWKRQQDRQKEDQAVMAMAEEEKKKSKFMETNGVKGAIHHPKEAIPSSSTSSGFVSANVSSDKKKIPSFWIPSLTPDNKETKLQRPDEKVRCPITGKPLRLKDLIEIKFEPIPDNDQKAVAFKGSSSRYRCAVTGDALSNSSSLIAIRQSGIVVTSEACERLIRPEMKDPKTGEKLTEKDLIPLYRGASGFAASGLKLQAKKETPVLQ